MIWKFKMQISKFKIFYFLLAILTFNFLLLTFFPITPVHAQTCGGSATKLAEGLVSAPSIEGTFTTTGGCLVTSKSAFAPFSIPTYADLKSKYYTQSKKSKQTIGALSTITDQTVYLVTGNLTLDLALSGAGSALVFVDGDLYIPINITYGTTTSGLVFIVQGKVRIHKDVTRIDAVIIAEGEVCTASSDGTSNCPTSDTPASQLIVNGSLISINQSDATPLKFKRTLDPAAPINNSNSPAEKMIQQPKYLVLLKDLLSDTTQKWSEITGSIANLPIPPCVNGYKDADGDGKGAGTFACFPASPAPVNNNTDCDDSHNYVYELRSVVRDADLDGKTAQTTLSSNCVGAASGSAYKDINNSPTWLTTATNPADCNDAVAGPCPPTVTTSAASNIGNTYATLNGTANPNGLATTGYFRYQANTSPGTCNDSFGTRFPASSGSALSGTVSVPYSQAISSGLSPSTIYYFCAIGNNSDGTSFGSVLSFTTVTCGIKIIGTTIIIGSLSCIGTPAATTFPSSGLVAYYKMNEATGTTVADAKGTSTGSATGTSILAGKLGNGRSFNGTSDYINIPVAAGSALDINNATNIVTISAWVKPANVNNSRQGIFNRGYCGCQAGGSGYGVGIGTNGNAKFNLGGMAGGNFDGTSNAANSNWYHIVGVTNGASSQIWVNGVSDSTGNISIAGGSSALAAQIGTVPQSVAPNPSSFFNGIIDEVGIWNRALTGAEISSLYNNGIGLTY